jgi:hypothetical protein
MIADNGCFDLMSNRGGDCIAGDQTRATFAALGAHGTNQASVNDGGSYDKTNRMRLPDSRPQVLPAYRPRLKRAETGETAYTNFRHEYEHDHHQPQIEQ